MSGLYIFGRAHVTPCWWWGLPSPRPKPAVIGGVFAKLKLGRGQGKAAKGLVRGLGDLFPLLHASTGTTGLSSNWGEKGNFKQQGAVTPFFPLMRDGTSGDVQTQPQFPLHRGDGTSFPRKAFRRDFTNTSGGSNISPHPWEGRGSQGTHHPKTGSPDSPLHCSV